MLKILIVSVGSLVGQNILETLNSKRKKMKVIGTDASPEAANLYRCDTAYLVPMTDEDPEIFKETLLEIISQEKPDLIIPARDHDAVVLSKLRISHPHLVKNIVCGDLESIRIMQDKWKSYQFSVHHGLPFVPSAISNPDTDHAEVKQLVNDYGFPLLVKPRAGYGSLGVYLIVDEDQLSNALNNQEVIVQQYLDSGDNLKLLKKQIETQGIPLFISLESDKYSTQTFVKSDKSFTPFFCTIHKMVMGRSLEVIPFRDKEISNISERFAEAFAEQGWVGPLNIQFQKDPSGEYYAFEFNGRFTGATAARYFLGYDEINNTIQSMLGVSLNGGESEFAQLQTKVIRSPVSQVVSIADIEQLRKDKIWNKKNESTK
jgi:carbamoyl-phosphate synthase large subunit